MVMDEAEKEMTAYHEAGHAIVGRLVPEPAGGYFVHPEFSTSIITKLRDRVWIRQLADLYTIGSAQLKLPVWDRTYTLPAVAEKGTIAVQSADTAGQKTFTPHKRSTILQITQELLEDSFFDVEAKLREMVIEQIAEIEEPLFIEGTGAGEPTGILNATGITALDILTSGSGDMVPEDIVKVPMQLTAAYRRNKATVRWGIPRAQLLKIMLMRSNDDGANTGEFMWNPNFATGKPAELQGYVVEETEFMTAASQDGDPLLFFGDLRKYAIVDHGGISVQKLIELYILNEMVGLKFTKRMDAGVTDVNGFVRLNRT
jgi:HK97 family phage major capsid protein